jgi:RNA polymerase sigma-70 factor (ECF subfamily)
MPEPTRDDVVKAAFQHRDALKGYALALLRDWSLAEDVVQDAFIVVMNKWENYRPGSSVFPWVRQIVHLKALEALRARRPAASIDPGLLDRVAATLQERLDEEAAGRQKAMREALQHCMSSLNRKAIGILAGFYAGSKSCEDIASAQNSSVNSVRITLSRVRKQLHECMVRRLSSQEARG